MAARDGITRSIPSCVVHPPLSVWPMRNLVLHSCPGCTAQAYEDREIGRMIRARQLANDV